MNTTMKNKSKEWFDEECENLKEVINQITKQNFRDSRNRHKQRYGNLKKTCRRKITIKIN